MQRPDIATSAFPTPQSEIAGTRIAPKMLRAELRSHLADTQLAWALHKGGCDLLIPGHAPIPYIAGAAELERLQAGGKLSFYEEVTTLVLSYLLDRFRLRVFYDIGASSGYFSSIAVSYAYSAVTAHAFDMRADDVARLQERAANDPMLRRLAVHHVGLTSKHRGEVDIWFARSRLFESKPGPEQYQDGIGRRIRHALRNDHSRDLKAGRVLMTSLDAFAPLADVAPDILKIDVEGYEGAVLLGASRILANNRPFVILELHRDKKILGMRRRDVADLLFQHGYEAIFFTDHHDRRHCDVVAIGGDHRLLARQETDLVLFYHPERLHAFDPSATKLS